jgi:hypothetical protein
MVGDHKLPYEVVEIISDALCNKKSFIETP